MAGYAEHSHMVSDLALAGGAKADKCGAELDVNLLDSKVSAPDPRGDHQSLRALETAVQADPFSIPPPSGNDVKE